MLSDTQTHSNKKEVHAKFGKISKYWKGSFLRNVRNEEKVGVAGCSIQCLSYHKTHTTIVIKHELFHYLQTDTQIKTRIEIIMT